MNQLVQSELFDLVLVVGTYIAATCLSKKTHLSLLHPLLTSIFVIIALLELLEVPYESFQQGSHLIHFMLGPSVVALGYVLYAQMQYLKGNVVSILTSVFVGAIVGITSVIIIGKLMGADPSLIATLQPKSVTTPIAMGISEKNGGIPSLTAAVVVCVGLLGGMLGFKTMHLTHIGSPMAQGLSMGTAAHAVGTSAAMEVSRKYGAFASLGLTLNGILTALLTPTILRLLGLL